MTMSTSSPRVSAELDHLKLSSPGPGRLAAFYEQALGMRVRRQDGLWICRGPNRTLILSEGAAGGVDFIAYRVSGAGDLDELRRDLGLRNVPVGVASTPLFDPGALCLTLPGGQTLAFGHRAQKPQEPQESREDPSARLQHVVLAVRDIVPIENFLTSVVGFAVSDRVVDPDGVPHACFLRSGREHHTFAMFSAPEARLDHHCYETDDWNAIRAWADHFSNQRIAIQWGPGRHGPGNNIFMFINDPDGNRIEISAELEVIDDDRAPGSWPHEERTTNLWGRGFLRDALTHVVEEAR
jgi:catechol-2,3-dioxygenase